MISAGALLLLQAIGCGSHGQSLAMILDDAGQDEDIDGGARPEDGGAGGGDGDIESGVIMLKLSPASAEASVGGRVQFRAQVSGVSDRSVTWSVQEGSAAGSVSPTGEYTAPSVAGTYHVVATSKADPSKTATSVVVVTLPPGTRPELNVGVWKNISPGGVPFGQIGDNQVLASAIAIDPSHPATLYQCVNGFNNKNFQIIPGGVYKTTDAGTTWKKVGMMDSPVRIAVNPGNSKHLYVTDGVRGSTFGFWVSEDGGNTWSQPAGFKTITSRADIATPDAYSLAVDPEDFQHVLLAFHYGWSNNGTYTNTAGVLESMDGGKNWIAHKPADGQLGLGFFIMFLSHPPLGIGNKNTWLLGTQQSGFWKTTDAGTTWKQVSTNDMAHEGTNLFYSKTGDVYVGAAVHPMKSSDNGSTWTMLDATAIGYYSAVQGDGTNLYVQPNGFMNSDRPFQVSRESDGLVWSAQPGGQTFTGGPAQMAFDSASKIIYASSWTSGLWALKTH